VSSATESLLEAAEHGQASQVRKLLAEGADVNDKNVQGETALMKSAANGHAALTVTLILLGAAPAEQDRRGRTALMAAAENGESSVIHAWLVLEGFLLRVQSLGAGAGGVEELRRLTGIDAKTLEGLEIRPISLPVFDLEKIQDKEGETALMKAAGGGHTNCARELLNHHVGPVGLRDKKGQTALMHAVANRKIAFLRDMLEFTNAGVGTDEGSWTLNTFLDPEESPWTDRDGKTVIQRAEAQGDPEIADLLRRYLDDVIEHDTEFITKGSKGGWIFHRHRAFAYRARGDREKAEADLREAKRLGDPN